MPAFELNGTKDGVDVQVVWSIGNGPAQKLQSLAVAPICLGKHRQRDQGIAVMRVVAQHVLVEAGRVFPVSSYQEKGGQVQPCGAVVLVRGNGPMKMLFGRSKILVRLTLSCRPSSERRCRQAESRRSHRPSRPTGRSAALPRHRRGGSTGPTSRFPTRPGASRDDGR